MSLKQKPISPHLQIYNIFSAQLTSGLSILNRLSAVVLLIAFLYMSIFLVCSAFGEHYYNAFLKFNVSLFGQGFLAFIMLCFFYYIFSSIRFLIFDLGYMINKKAVFISGTVVIILTIVSFIGTWLYVFFVY